MTPDVKAKLAELALRGELASPERLPDPPKPPRRKRKPAPRTIAQLLESFTPETAFRFIFERTVPPATEDGLALIESYPELSVAAPELVADMALAFRHKQPNRYADHFALIAKHHGIAL